jgi:hypothetical protein
MKTALKVIIIVFFCFLSAGCTYNNGGEIPVLPNLSIPENMLNKDLRVTAPAAWNDLKKEEDFIDLSINLVTDKQIVTLPDFNAEIYIYDDIAKQWIIIENLGNYETPPDEIFMRQGDVKGLAILPDLSQTTDSQNNLLILVSGNIVENGNKTNKVIGTYIILALKP